MEPYQKKIVAASVISIAVILCGYYIYKKRPIHRAIFLSAAGGKVLEKCPIPFERLFQLPKHLEELLELSEELQNRYCRDLIYSSETISTSKIIEEYFEDLNDGLLYVADIQTAGLGRTGPWISPVGCLMFTYKHSCNMAFALPLQLVIPLAIIRSIKNSGKARGITVNGLEAKWPNDVYLQGKKIGGILVNSQSSGKNCVMSIGIGINVNNVGENISLEELFPKTFSRGIVLKQYFIEFDKLAKRFGTEGWEKDLEEEYKAVWMHYNKEVVITKNNEKAVVIDISQHGVIIAKDKNGVLYNIHSREDIRFL